MKSRIYCSEYVALCSVTAPYNKSSFSPYEERNICSVTVLGRPVCSAVVLGEGMSVLTGYWQQGHLQLQYIERSVCSASVLGGVSASSEC
jgi:hypothetical protein